MPVLTVKTLDQKRTTYDPDLWKKYQDLYAGGKRILARAATWLVRNTAESQKWYEERLARFTYKNIVGSIVDDYAATVLQEPLEMNLAKEDGKEERPEPDEFYTKDLWPDPTGTGEGDLNQLAYKMLTRAMVKKESWVLIAQPDEIPGYEPETFAQQEEAGLLRFMLRPIDSENVIACHYDQRGLAWVRLKHRYASQDPTREIGPNDKPMETIQWTLYTRKSVQSWAIQVKQGEQPDETAKVPMQQEETAHHLADANDDFGAVPVRCFKLDETLWLLDRVALVVTEELRKRNALGWYEYLTCFPQLAHSGEEELTPNAEDGGKTPKRGGQYCWEVGKDDTLVWLEPAGSSLEHVSKRLENLERDIYKGVQQMAAAQGPGAAAAIQSGASKVRDNLAKTILCERYASLIRTEIKEIASLVSQARAEDYDWEVSGASRFETQDSETTTKNHAVVQNLAFTNWSPTFVRQMAMKTVRSNLPDAPTKVLDQIAVEIEEMDVKNPDEQAAEMVKLAGIGGTPGVNPPGGPQPPGNKPKEKKPAGAGKGA